MEIADIFVVNKADREGADRTVASIEAMLSLQAFADGRVAAADRQDRGDDRHGRPGAAGDDRARSARTPRRRRASRRRARAEWRLRELLGQRFMQHVEQRRARRRRVRRDRSIASRRARLDPYTAVDEILGRGRSARRPETAAR